jgi:hypothetical protein
LSQPCQSAYAAAKHYQPDEPPVQTPRKTARAVQVVRLEPTKKKPATCKCTDCVGEYLLKKASRIEKICNVEQKEQRQLLLQSHRQTATSVNRVELRLR